MGLTYVTEVHRYLFIILNDTSVKCLYWIYDILWVSGSLMQRPNSKAVSVIFSPCLCYLLHINIILHYKLVTVCYVIFPLRLIIEGCKNPRKIIIHLTHHKPYGFIITDVIGLHMCIVYIIFNIYILLHGWFYDILCAPLIFQIPI